MQPCFSESGTVIEQQNNYDPMFPPLNEQMDLLLRGISEVVPEEEFEKKIAKSIKNNQPLIIKQGFDPSAPDLHLGHTVSIRKLKQFQDLGHTVNFVIGDFTGLVGDPTGRNLMRPRMTREDIAENAKTYENQVYKILDPQKTIVRFNSDWLGKLDIYQVLELTARHTVARMLERDDFEKRYRDGKPIAILEFLYPLFQAYDSVELKCDVELGGTDQKFNLLLGRHLQHEFGQPGQIVFLMPLLVGTDGTDKMSKSLGNYIGIDDPPSEIYGKTLSIPDEQIYPYFELTTNISMDELRKVKEELEGRKVNPRDLKRRLARTIVTIYHDEEKALKAEQDFDKLFIKKEIPDDIPENTYPRGEIMICKLISELGLTSSSGEAKRMIKQGGVKIDDKKINDPAAFITIDSPFVLKVGKRRMVKVIPE